MRRHAPNNRKARDNEFRREASEFASEFVVHYSALCQICGNKQNCAL
jgi:hypothetical protein